MSFAKLMFNKPEIHQLAFKIALGNRLLADVITEKVIHEMRSDNNITWEKVQISVMGYYDHPLQKEYADCRSFLRRYRSCDEAESIPPAFTDKQDFEKLCTVKDRWASFEQSKAYLKTLSLESFPHWRRYIKSGELPKNIPRSPEICYREQWAGWRDFLGILPYLDYRECKEWVQRNLVSRGIFTVARWRKIGKCLPDFIPASPETSYQNKGWISWTAFFEAPSKKTLLLSYPEARLFSHHYLVPAGIDSLYAYNMARAKSLFFLPIDPRRYYVPEGWSIPDFFKTKKQKLSYE